MTLEAGVLSRLCNGHHSEETSKGRSQRLWAFKSNTTFFFILVNMSHILSRLKQYNPCFQLSLQSH